jgi:hypothetical protein
MKIPTRANHKWMNPPFDFPFFKITGWKPVLPNQIWAGSLRYHPVQIVIYKLTGWKPVLPSMTSPSIRSQAGSLCRHPIISQITGWKPALPFTAVSSLFRLCDLRFNYPNDAHQFIIFDRLSEKRHPIKAGFIEIPIDVAMRCCQNDGRMCFQRFYLIQQIDAATFQEEKVGNDKIEFPPAQTIQRLFFGGSHHYLITVLAKNLGQSHKRISFVIDQKNCL